MNTTDQHQAMVTDYATGKSIPDIGAEANRQAIERFLIDIKGYAREDLVVNYDVNLEIAGQPYRTQLDLVIVIDGQPAMVFKCAAGSLDSRQREVIAAARVAFARPVAFAVASDGKTALVYDAIHKKLRGQGLDQIPSPETVREMAAHLQTDPLPADRLEKEKIIFRSYDIMNVNVRRNTGNVS